mmetsp:Transcript_26017/g.24866  ORF Transcript_26017/g.24866 Transcript_26017/m.24866 type:complete len:267 (-) Transcript_26017:60-860(-)
MSLFLPFFLLIWSAIQSFYSMGVDSFTPLHLFRKINSVSSRTYRSLKSDSPEEYKDPLTKVVSNFITKEKTSNNFDNIDWDQPKIKKIPLDSLAKKLEIDLTIKEWFVNGNVEPSYFSDDFEFQDPNVKTKGIKDYAIGVNKIFSQKDSRAEIIAVRKSETKENTLTVSWRLSGTINIALGLRIKPFIVFTDFIVDSDGLIISQEDIFSIPGQDIVLSAFFPFLIDKFFLPPAPSIDILKSEYLAEEKEKLKLLESSKPKKFFGLF